MAYLDSKLKIIKIKKALILSVLFLIASCGVQKKIAKDPYVGTYDFTIFEVDNYGDIPVKLNLTKEDEEYTSVMTFNSEDSSAGEDIRVDSTTLEEGVFTIEAYTAGYDIYFELSIEQNDISGSMMGMYDVSGTRVKD